MTSYTDEQLNELAGKIELFSPMGDVIQLLVDSDDGMNMKDIGEKLGLNAYPRDKAMLALEFAGFINKKAVSGSKVYWITESGKKLHEIIRGRN